MKITVYAVVLFLFVSTAATRAQKLSYVGSIVCFSDSAKGSLMAEDAARFLAAEGREKYYGKVFVVTTTEEKEDKRFIILILSDEGATALDKGSAPFKEDMRPLLEKMKRAFGDERVSVMLQLPDKTNVLEALFDEAGTAAIKVLKKKETKPPPTQVPTPAADTTFVLP